MVRNVGGQFQIVQLGFAGAVVRLDEQAPGFAVRDDALKACFKAAAGAEDDDGGDLAVHFVAVGCVALGGLYSCGFEAHLFHRPGGL